MNILIDFDGVVADSARAIIEMFSKRYERNIDYNPKELMWDFSPYVTNKDEMDYCVDCFKNPKMYRDMEVIDEPSLRKFLEYCKHKGHRTILCSHRPIGGFDLCVNFINEHRLDFDDYAFINSFDKSIIGGSDSIIIDDQERCLKGDRVSKFLFGEYGYQKDYNKEDFVCVKNWGEALSALKIVEANKTD